MTERRKKSMWSWRNKLLLLLAVFAAAPIAVLSYWTLQTIETTFEQTTRDALLGMATAKAQAIDQFTSSRRSDVERIAGLVAPRMHAVLSAEAEATAEEAPLPAQELPELRDAEALPPQPGGGTGEGASNRGSGRGATQPATTPPQPIARTPGENGGPPGELRGNPTEERRQQQIAESQSALRQTIGLILWDQQVFEELLVIDVEGRVIASTFEGHEERSAAARDYFQGGLRSTWVQPPFVSPITNRLTMVIATPIRDETRRVIGVLAARLNLDRFFRLINERTGLGNTGETVVAKQIGDEIVFMAPTRHDPDAALQRRLKIGARQLGGLQEAARGQSGTAIETDYRNLCTLAAWQPVPELDWGLLVKIDCDEARAPVVQAQNRLIFLILAVLIASLVASAFVARALVAPLQKLKTATERISRGDFDVQLGIKSRDEVGELADSFERMIAAIKFFREHSRRAEEEEEDEALEDERAGTGTT